VLFSIAGNIGGESIEWLPVAEDYLIREPVPIKILSHKPVKPVPVVKVKYPDKVPGRGKKREVTV
jgi:hypothetical protein